MLGSGYQEQIVALPVYQEHIDRQLSAGVVIARLLAGSLRPDALRTPPDA